MNTDSGNPPDPRPVSIDAGLPNSPNAWPPGTLDALKSFTQGHVVEAPPLFYFADPSRPVWGRTHAYTADSEGPEVIELRELTGPPYGLITTQTCDIGEEDADTPIRPWVQICPIYDRSNDLDSGWRSKLRKGGGPRYLMHVPAISDGFWVADFRIEVPVEKGWLATRAPIDGFADEAAQRRVGERIALLRSRPAFAPRFVDLVQRPLVGVLKKLRADNLSLYQSMDEKDPEVAVELDSFLDPRVARVTLLVEHPVDEAIEEWWRGWWDAASEQCEAGGLTLQPFAIREASQISLAEYRRMTTLPLSRISPD
jgi:hypothetical protein